MEKYDVSVKPMQKPIDKITIDKVKYQIKNYKFDDALKGVYSLIAQANKYLDSKAPWKTANDNPDEAAAVLQNVSSWIVTIAVLMYPFMPIASRKIECQFKGPKVKKEENLFPRIK